MSSIINKVKDAITPNSGAKEGEFGPHGNRAANAADPRVDSDRDHSATVGHSTNDTHTSSGNYGLTSGPAPNTAGPHKSDMMNRMDPRIDSDKDNSRTLGGNPNTGTNIPEGSVGPHGSRVANMLDPRVDSDKDRTMGPGAHSHPSSGPIGTTFGAGSTGTTGSHLTSGTHGTTEGAHGPHGNRVANALDPTVDSDRDGSKTVGNRGTGSQFTSGTHGTGSHLTSGTHGTGSHLTSGTHGTSEGIHGPHGNRVANALDPTVDSDRDGSKTVGNRGTGTTTGDHLKGHVGAAVGGPEGTGPAPHTAGPHKSDMLNKLDPRVDSDLDGSKTIFGDKTFSQS
jgi:hypothetical protein